MVDQYNEKYLILTRGIPGSGKSTFVKNNFTNRLIWHIVSSDEIRLSLNGLNSEGRISQDNPNIVWGNIYREVMDAISVGQSVVLDSTGVSKSLIRKYAKIAESFNYNFIILNFLNVPYLECLRRNLCRESYAQVPEEHVKAMYDKMLSQDISKYRVIDYKYFEMES